MRVMIVGLLLLAGLLTGGWLLADPVVAGRPVSDLAKSLQSGNIVIVVDRRAEGAFICPQRARSGFTCARVSDGKSVKPPFAED